MSIPVHMGSDTLIKHYCARDDLSTYDPFDIWKSPIGFRVKNFHNHHRRLGFLPAAGLTVFDAIVNNRLRLFYRTQEFPIVRAWAVQILLNTYERHQAEWALEFARIHLEWLRDNSCRGYSGPCWGLGFHYAVDANLVYSANTPLSTMTPYALEAFSRYTEITGDSRFVDVLRGIFEFFEKDILIMEETDEYIVTSYAPMRDRRVVNAVSYALYSYSLLLPYIDESAQDLTTKKMRKLYAFIKNVQQDDGSWFYSIDSRSFIDCFHSCIVMKNLIKTNQTFSLPGSQSILERGYHYVKSSFYVDQAELFKRFSITYTPSLVQFDLYDNAEMLNLARLMKDDDMTRSLAAAIEKWFVRGTDIYSQIDRFGLRRNKNMLRWAVMPYLYALS